MYVSWMLVVRFKVTTKVTTIVMTKDSLLTSIIHMNTAPTTKVNTMAAHIPAVNGLKGVSSADTMVSNFVEGGLAETPRSRPTLLIKGTVNRFFSALPFV